MLLCFNPCMTCQLRLSVTSILQVNLDGLVTAYSVMHKVLVHPYMYAKLSNPHMQKYQFAILHILLYISCFFMHQTNNSLKKRLLSDFLGR